MLESKDTYKNVNGGLLLRRYPTYAERELQIPVSVTRDGSSLKLATAKHQLRIN